MLRLPLSALVALAFLSPRAAPVDLSSPDGSVTFRLSTDAERGLVYSVIHDGRERIEPSRAGIVVDGVDLGAGATLGAPRCRSISEEFPWRGNKRTGTNRCRACEVPVRSGRDLDWVLEVRVFDDGAGFRYGVPGEGVRRVAGEPTGWQLPEDSTVWYQTNTANYEGVYRSSPAGKVPLEVESGGKSRPVHIGPPMTVAFSDGGFAMISEVALYDYSGLTLRPERDAKFRAAFQDDPGGWDQKGPILSPWRVIVLARDLDGLVQSDVIPALCDPPDPELFPDGPDTTWIRPGKAPCTWMVFGNDGAQWDRQKWFVDVSAAMGCEYLLVDAGWRSDRWGWLRDGGDVWERAAELCRYAAEREVGIVLWHAYPEGRDDSPGLTTVAAREEFFSKCREAGVKGVKIDFFDSESRETIDVYEDLLRRSAKHRLLINFHGANKPTGEARTWPHEITREGIREQEYVLWDVLPLSHYGALPFTRMAAGHADFLPGYVQERFLKNTTIIFQMASVIVFSSPFLCWPDHPEAYLDSPLLQFVRTVPVVWDETRVLPGSVIGDTVILARRSGASWYVAALNCRAEKRTLDLDLGSIDSTGKEWTVYRDGPRGKAFEIEAGVQPPRDGRVSADLRAGGGIIVQSAPPGEHPGWR